MNEENVLRVFQFDLEYSIHILGKTKSIRPIRTVIGFLVAIALWAHFNVFFAMPVDTIWNFVVYLLAITVWFMFVTYLTTHFRESDRFQQIYDAILATDVQMNTSIANQTDWMLQGLASIDLMAAVLTTTFIFGRGFKNEDIPFFSFIPFCHQIIEVIVLKYLISKRLRIIRSAEEFMERVEDTIVFTRRLLECNTRLNTAYCRSATAFTAFTCQLALQLLYTMWVVYVAGVETMFDSMSHPVHVTILCCTICSVATLLASFSTLVNNEVCSECLFAVVDINVSNLNNYLFTLLTRWG